MDGKIIRRGARGQAGALRVGCNPSLVTTSSLEMGTVSLRILKSGVMVPFPHTALVSLALERPVERWHELREEEKAPTGFPLKSWLFLFFSLHLQ